MNEPPLSSPHRFTCPRCGFGFDMNAAYCPNCGQPLGSSSASNSTLRIVAQVVLCLVALCSGGFGACMFLLFGLESSLTAETLLMGGVPIVIMILCIVGVFLLARKKR